ncbi:MAG: ATP-binding cassette domain-containing protein [Alphaproteobacteria bacterium]|nr:ATP-binding cassette domain-containing protein [Alphaproteobacteria bacterium]
MLDIRHLSFSYDQKAPLLKDISLTVSPGELTVLIGPSGAGKTTLLRCMALLENPQQGEICIDDERLVYPLESQKTFTPPWPKVTVVFQQLFLWPHLTLRENILLPTKHRKDPTIPDKLEALIHAFDMQGFIDKYPNEASLGQRQRVALARALILEPHYLLLDEITSSLDVEQIAKLLSYLKSLRGQNIGIFIITHLLSFARHTADRVFFMADGRIEESGTASILRAPQTERLAQFLSVVATVS